MVSDEIAVKILLDMDKVKDFSTSYVCISISISIISISIRPALSIALQDVVNLQKHTNPVNRGSPNSCNTSNNPTTDVAENLRNFIFLLEFEIPNYQTKKSKKRCY